MVRPHRELAATDCQTVSRPNRAARPATRRIPPMGRHHGIRSCSLVVVTGLASGIALAASTVRVAAADRDESDAARIDWAAGRVAAGGTGIADRHAPSPAVALGTSRRGAELAAKQRLAGKLGSLP